MRHLVRSSPPSLSPTSAWGLLFLIHLLLGSAAPAAADAALLDVRKIWDAAPHNAFTDLVRWRDRWWCVFREGQGHVSPDGAIRVLTSGDGTDWTSAARLVSPRGDLRDPHAVVTPDGRLMLHAAVAITPPSPSPKKHQSVAWFSADGKAWGEPSPIGEPDVWLWRIAWRGDLALGVGYDTAGGRSVRLYSSRDGKQFDTLVPKLFAEPEPNESGLAFLPDGTCLCLLRRDGSPGTGQLGRARPPYRDWTWQDLGTRIGGPQLLRLPDGRLIAAARFHDGGAHTALAWLDAEAGRLREFLKLPSGGDCSYPGLVWDEGRLWVSYYSSHEGKAAIYLARVKL